MRFLTSALLLGAALPLYLTPLREGEGEGAAAGAGAGASGTGSGAGTAGGGGGSWAPPEGLPAEYVGADAAETLNKLFPAFTQATTRADGLRDKLAKMPTAPDKPEGYQFTFNDKIAPFFPDPDNNKAMGFARAAFHKHGLSPQQAQGIIEDVYGPMIEGGFIQPPFNPQAEITSFAKHHGLDNAAAASALAEAESFAKGLLGQLNLPAELREGAQAELLALTDTAPGNAVLRALAKRLNDSGIRVPNDSTGAAGGPMSDSDLDKLTADPRIDPRNEHHADAGKRYDPDLRKRYDEGMAERGRRKYGTTARG